MSSVTARHKEGRDVLLDVAWGDSVEGAAAAEEPPNTWLSFPMQINTLIQTL